MAAELSLVKKGKNCVAVVKSALHDISNGYLEYASTKLHGLRDDSLLLAAEAEKLTKRLETVEKYFIAKEESVHKEIGKLGRREEDLKGEKNIEETRLGKHRSVLRDEQSRLSSAQDELREAERKLDKAQRDAKTGLVTGAVVGVITFGLVGAAVGASVAAIVNACKAEVAKAKSNVDRRESDRERARSAVRASENQISSIVSEIDNLEVKISRLKEERLRFHEKAGEIKQDIILIKKSVEFWQLFKQASEHGAGRTSLLEKIVNKANEKGDYRALHSGGSRRVAKTFLEAWEDMESMAEDGGSSHKLAIEFTCAYCRRNCTALPHVDSASRLVCVRCCYAIQN